MNFYIILTQTLILIILGSFKKENEKKEKKPEKLKQIDESYASNSSEEKKINTKKKSKSVQMFGKHQKLDDGDRNFVYKRMEDLNNLEHRFNLGRDDKDKGDNCQKFNYKYHDMKRQL